MCDERYNQKEHLLRHINKYHVMVFLKKAMYCVRKMIYRKNIFIEPYQKLQFYPISDVSHAMCATYNINRKNTYRDINLYHVMIFLKIHI